MVVIRDMPVQTCWAVVEEGRKGLIIRGWRKWFEVVRLEVNGFFADVWVEWARDCDWLESREAAVHG